MTENAKQKRQLYVCGKRVEIYREAINEIDDYFEYANDSEVDKKVVRKILSDLTEKLVKSLTGVADKNVKH